MPHRYPGNCRCFQRVWGGHACNHKPSADWHSHQRGDRPCAYTDKGPIDGVKQSNGCPSKMPHRYPGTNRCFAGIWRGPACNVDVAADRVFHHKCDRQCNYPKVRRTRGSGAPQYVALYPRTDWRSRLAHTPARVRPRTLHSFVRVFTGAFYPDISTHRPSSAPTRPFRPSARTPAHSVTLLPASSTYYPKPPLATASTCSPAFYLLPTVLCFTSSPCTQKFSRSTTAWTTV